MIPERRKGNQTPTLHIFKEGSTNIYDTTVVARNISSWISTPFPWQELVYRDIFTTGESGEFQYKTVCLSVPRRNGKTEIIIGTMLVFAILLNAKVLYTAQIQDTADDIYSRFMDLVQSRKSRLHLYFPGIQRKTKVSEEVIQAIDPQTGIPLGTLEFRGRRGDKGRGITRDVLIVDEAQDYDGGEEQRFGSINGSSEIGLTLLVGTPPPLDQKTDSLASGTVFRQLRDEALSEKDLPWHARQKRGTAWIEWGADSIKDKLDRDAWYRYNPSMGYLPKKALSEEWFENRPSSVEAFSVENLGYWSQQSKDRAIEISSFNRLAVTGKELMEGLTNCKYALAFKSDPGDRAMHLGIAFRRKDEKIAYQHLKTIYPDEEGWDRELEAIIVDLTKRSTCVSLMIDGGLAKSAITPILIKNRMWSHTKSKARQGKIFMATMGDIALASETLLTAISSRRLIHSSPAPLHSAVEDSKKRKLGSTDGFGFMSISGVVDVVPLEVCALAIHGIENLGQLKKGDMGNQYSDQLSKSLGAL